jgi:hypothetical protein
MNLDLHHIAEDMNSATEHAEGEGLAVGEYDEFAFDPKFRQRVQFAMDRWENGCDDLRQATKEMLQIAQEMP